ncbi:MAG: isochorismatase family protein [Deltaproteobacteria bacterium]|nr:MAG: isochorismatase family protein [Deltaproteobacteria bacterium]
MSRRESRVLTLEAEPEPIEIDLAKTAVIVVDMQNAFMSRGGYFDLIGMDISAIQKIVEPCGKIIHMGREKGVKIIYLQMGYSPDLSDAGPPGSPSFHKSGGLNFVREHPELKDKLYFYGTWGAEIIEALKPHQEDIVIKKQKYDGFVGTNLDAILRTLSIKYLLFLGIATNVCVESTLRHAFFLDYFPILVSDAVSQKGPRVTQEATLLNVQSTFGWVTDSIKLIRAIDHIKS